MSPSLNPEQRLSHLNAEWRVLRAYGLTLSSDFAFANRLLPATGTPDLVFTCVENAPLPGGWELHATACTGLHRTEDGESGLYVYHLASCDVLRFTRVADFFLWPKRIVCHLLDPVYHYAIEIRLLGTVLSFWLERKGIRALHASAVVVNGRVAAFLSTNKGGKSALVASLMQEGHPLLTDDILSVERGQDTFLGRPGYPNMRMWPDEAQHFLGRHDDLGFVHPALSKRRVPVGPGGYGTFCDEPQPLDRIYLPERRDPVEGSAEIEITPVSPPDAVIELVRNSFAATIVEALGWQPRRLGFFAQMVEEVPVRRLVYPSGFTHLPPVRDAVLADLAKPVCTTG